MKINHVIPLMLVFVSLLIGGISQAYAICQPFVVGKPESLSPSSCHPFNPNPILFNQNFQQDAISGTVGGVAYASNSTMQGTLTFTGLNGIQVSADFSKNIITTTLPHSVIQVSKISLSNGSVGFEMYLYTQSTYAPNGTSGTFIFDANGNLIQGSTSQYQQLANDIYDADPNEISLAHQAVTAGLFGGGGLTVQGQACAFVLGAAAINVAGIVDPIPTGLLSIGWDLTNWNLISSNLTTCF